MQVIQNALQLMEYALLETTMQLNISKTTKNVSKLHFLNSCFKLNGPLYILVTNLAFCKLIFLYIKVLNEILWNLCNYKVFASLQNSTFKYLKQTIPT